jgi:hypothetical protein
MLALRNGCFMLVPTGRGKITMEITPAVREDANADLSAQQYLPNSHQSHLCPPIRPHSPPAGRRLSMGGGLGRGCRPATASALFLMSAKCLVAVFYRLWQVTCAAKALVTFTKTRLCLGSYGTRPCWRENVATAPLRRHAGGVVHVRCRCMETF